MVGTKAVPVCPASAARSSAAVWTTCIRSVFGGGKLPSFTAAT